LNWLIFLIKDNITYILSIFQNLDDGQKGQKGQKSKNLDFMRLAGFLQNRTKVGRKGQKYGNNIFGWTFVLFVLFMS